MAECIPERVNAIGEPTELVWHLAGAGDSWWRRIRCSTDGIALPPHGVDREPTCVICAALIEAQTVG